MQNKKYSNFIVIFIWLVIWQIASCIVNEPVLLVGPVETFKTVILNLQEAEFYFAVLATVARIAAGLLLGIVLGIIFAILGKISSVFSAFFQPFIQFLKSVPVASFVVLFLIWWSSEYLAVAISFCVVFPQIYIHTLEGLKTTDEKMLEMAKVFRMPLKNRIFYIDRNSLNPFLKSSFKIVVGMAWKSGVAAEVISMGRRSIGGSLYSYKITLDTAGIFALTIVIILLSILFEKVLLKSLELFMAWKPKCQPVKIDLREKEKNFESEMEVTKEKQSAEEKQRTTSQETVLELKNICKSYGPESVIRNESGIYKTGEIYYFREASGKGKTTRFRLIAGLCSPDQGEIIRNRAVISYLFQEDRLSEDESAIKNLEMVCGDREKSVAFLREILPEDCLEKPCRELSGGMKRRVALARTFVVSSNLVLLDEPFNGLDEENQIVVKNAISRWSKGRCILIASHVF